MRCKSDPQSTDFDETLTFHFQCNKFYYSWYIECGAAISHPQATHSREPFSWNNMSVGGNINKVPSRTKACKPSEKHPRRTSLMTKARGKDWNEFNRKLLDPSLSIGSLPKHITPSSTQVWPFTHPLPRLSNVTSSSIIFLSLPRSSAPAFLTTAGSLK